MQSNASIHDAKHVPFGVNEMRLDARQWAAVLVVVAGLMLLIPRVLPAVGLTGNAGAIDSAARIYRVFYRKHRLSAGVYAMDHSSQIYLMGWEDGLAEIARVDARVPGLEIAVL